MILVFSNIILNQTNIFCLKNLKNIIQFNLYQILKIIFFHFIKFIKIDEFFTNLN